MTWAGTSGRTTTPGFSTRSTPMRRPFPCGGSEAPSPRPSSIYSRFARGFEHASGKDALYFKLHDNFFQRTISQPKMSRFIVVWYDATRRVRPGNWITMPASPTMKTALSVTGNGG